MHAVLVLSSRARAQAIDLIDEAGSRVRLRHAQLPEEARELDKELRALLKEKDAAVRGQARLQTRKPCLFYGPTNISIHGLKVISRHASAGCD